MIRSHHRCDERSVRGAGACQASVPVDYAVALISPATSERPYKKGWSPAEALRKMAEWTKGHFDPRLFQAFVKSVGIYPTGSLVRLESGRLGVVLEQHPESLLTPRVRVFFSARSKVPIPQEVVDLARGDRIESRESPEDWGFKKLDELWSGLSIGRGSLFD